MPFFLPRRGGTALLAACALLLRRRQSFADGLQVLAEEDPVLRPWARRLLPELQAGASPIRLLYQWRLLDRHEFRLLLEAEKQGCLAELFPTVLARHQSGLPIISLWRALPSLLVLALVCGGVFLHLLLGWLLGNPFAIIGRELGLRMEGSIFAAVALELPAWQAGLIASLSLLIVAGLHWLILRIPATQLLLVPLGLPLERARLASELLAWGRIANAAQQQGMSLPRRVWHWKWLAYCEALLLSRRLPRQDYRALASLDRQDLSGRLLCLGLVQQGDGGQLDWQGALDASLLEVQRVEQRLRPLLLILFLTALLGSFSEVVFTPVILFVNII